MIRALVGSVGLILLVIAAGFIAQRLFGSDSEDSIVEAQEAIETVAFPASARETYDGVLVGSLRGRNQIVHFAIADSPTTPAVVVGAQGWTKAPGPSGPLWLWDDAEADRRHQTRIGRAARTDLLIELEAALCRKTIGEACAP